MFGFSNRSYWKWVQCSYSFLLAKILTKCFWLNREWTHWLKYFKEQPSSHSKTQGAFSFPLKKSISNLVMKTLVLPSLSPITKQIKENLLKRFVGCPSKIANWSVKYKLSPQSPRLTDWMTADEFTNTAR